MEYVPPVPWQSLDEWERHPHAWQRCRLGEWDSLRRVPKGLTEEQAIRWAKVQIEKRRTQQ
jgi:hypothetical protein